MHVFVFSLFRWYFGAITQKDAENILAQPVNLLGSFLVRDNETAPGNYFLCIKDANTMRHYQIHNLDVGGFFITLRLTFETIPHLILHYRKKADGLCMTLKCAAVILQSDDFQEIDHSAVRATKQIEVGHLCTVFEGVWNNTTPVTIYTPREGFMSENQFLETAELMKQLKHSNVIKVYGVCRKEKPLCIIAEFMTVGNLHAYLRQMTTVLGQPQLIDMGAQIASGMAYLESKNCVHRNVRAKNVLLTELAQRLICKVANFSYARIVSENNCVKTAASEKFPIKWTAPETLKLGYFAVKSDVWSFGIVLYELITFGLVPYPGMENNEVIQKLETGYRMSCPTNCPEKFYKIMLECWNDVAETRPTFETLQWKLEDYYFSDYVEN